MIQLSGLALPDLLWSDRYSFTGVDSQVSKTLTGRTIVWEQETQGRPITLIGGEDFAWILKEDLDALFEMSKVPNATYELNYENETYLVRFRNEEQPAIEATQIISRPNEDHEDNYKNLVIKLMEV